MPMSQSRKLTLRVVKHLPSSLNQEGAHLAVESKLYHPFSCISLPKEAQFATMSFL